MAKKIFVTGACGFIGRNVAKEALKRGYEVVGADLNICEIDGANIIKADIREYLKMVKHMKGCDAVIHLAAITSNVEFEKDLSSSYQVNVEGFENVINAAINNGIKKVGYASSSAVYIDSFSEDSKLAHLDQKNHYAKSKMINEMMAQSYHEVYGMNMIGLRYFNAYGSDENEKGNYASIISQFIKCKRENKDLIIYDDGMQTRDFVYVKDVANITLNLLEIGENGIYNVGTGMAISYEEIAEYIDKNHKKHVPNPLKSYQYYTRADTAKLLSTIGNYKFTEVKEYIENSLKHLESF